MKPDIYIDHNGPNEAFKSDFTREFDTVGSSSSMGDAQDIPVVVVVPQDTLIRDRGEGSARLSVEDARFGHRGPDFGYRDKDLIERGNDGDDDGKEEGNGGGNDDDDDDDDDDDGSGGDDGFDDEDDGDEFVFDVKTWKRSSRTRRKGKLSMKDGDGPEVRTHSRETLILDEIKAQKELMDKVRFQSWHIEKKLKLIRKAKCFLKGHQSKLSKSQDYHQKSIMAFRTLKRELVNVLSLFIPWEMRIKKVESHFGSVVASYFLFLRWILSVNSLLTLLTVAFIVIPQTTVGDATHSVMIPKAEKPKSADLETLFNAEGIIKYSPFFYGYYDNKVIGHDYAMPLAYLVTGLVVYALSIIIVLRKMAANVRLNKMASKDEQFSFSWKVFNSWDYMVGHAETANNKYAAITTAFKESIREVEEKQKVEKKNLLIFLRTLGCLLTVGLLGASGYLTYLVVMASSNNTDPNKDFFELNKTTWVITAIFIVFPNFFDLISAMEQYHPRTNLRVQLARVFILNFLNVMTLMYSLYEKIIDNQCPSRVSNITSGIKFRENDPDGKNRLTSTPLLPLGSRVLSNSSAIGATLTSPLVVDCKPFKCWETYVGQEVFKITVLDLVMTIIMILLQDFLRGLFVRFCNSCWCWNLEKTFPEYAEFKTAENILHLINNQGMIWLGWFFAPGISVMNLVKLVVLAYVRFWSVLVCNVPQKRIFRASRSNNFYYALLLIMLFICCIPPMIVFFSKYSRDCGPLRDINNIMDLFVQNSPFVADVLRFASKPATSLILLGSLSLIIYYLWSTWRSMKEVNKDLKKTLEYERTEGKKKVYAIADAKRNREAAIISAQRETYMANSHGKDDRKSLNKEGCTFESDLDASKISLNLNPNRNLSKMKNNPAILSNKRLKRKQVPQNLFQKTKQSNANPKRLTLRSAKKEAERLQRETRLGEIKLAKLKKFQLDREIKDVENRILGWSEGHHRPVLGETSFHKSTNSECLQATVPPDEQRTTEWISNLPRTRTSTQTLLSTNKGESKTPEAGDSGAIGRTAVVPEVRAHCSHEMPGQRKSKPKHVTRLKKDYGNPKIDVKDEEREEEEKRRQGAYAETRFQSCNSNSVLLGQMFQDSRRHATQGAYDNEAFSDCGRSRGDRRSTEDNSMASTTGGDNSTIVSVKSKIHLSSRPSRTNKHVK